MNREWERKGHGQKGREQEQEDTIGG